MKHLTEKTRTFVETASIEERIEATRKFKWIGYTNAAQILKKMEDCLNYPKSIRMPNLLIVGDSNNGKTALLTKFDQSHLAYIDEKTDKLINPVLMIQAPPEPDEKRFYNAILEKLFAPTRTSEKIDSRQSRVKNLLKHLEVKAIVIDEIHHVLAGSPSKQRLFLNVLKHLSNELQIPLICAGTKLAFNAIQSDSQLANRFEPRILPRWTNNTEYKRLLLSFSMVLPLKKESSLVEGSIANKILTYSDGLIGEISKILELSTILAIESGAEHITNSIIENIDYIPPTQRKKAFYN
ncbi:MAG: hypothetical protein A2W99_06435 [Bacteroidetes bacterium GWF2_33_16]|nr:MAG: hypothetical protein A2X00_11125 [Bacteroidetes bacterium GWE2_32_14]OFY05317.1 MAG: hypothetical protein A2W99_06435 [Bacteroidetes bacterium GWF2_33_16]